MTPIQSHHHYTSAYPIPAAAPKVAEPKVEDSKTFIPDIALKAMSQDAKDIRIEVSNGAPKPSSKPALPKRTVRALPAAAPLAAPHAQNNNNQIHGCDGPACAHALECCCCLSVSALAVGIWASMGFPLPAV